MKKQDLYDYVNDLVLKAYAETKELTKGTDSIIRAKEESLDCIISEAKKNYAYGLINAVEELSSKFSVKGDFFITNIVNSIGLNNVNRYLKDNILLAKRQLFVGKATTLIENIFSKSEIDIIKEESRTYNARIKEIQELKETLFSVIKNCKSAKNAFNSLKELGLDMSGFKVKENMLPSDVKEINNIKLLKSEGDK